jgi:hypothetical protein
MAIFRSRDRAEHHRFLDEATGKVLLYEAHRTFKFLISPAMLCRIATIFLAILTMTQSAASALVLCHTGDGHLAIEMAHHTPCRQIGQDHHGRTGGANALSGSTEPVSTESLSAESTPTVPSRKHSISQKHHDPICVDTPLGHDVMSHKVSAFGKSFTQLIRQAFVILAPSVHSSAGSTIQYAPPHGEVPTPPGNTLLALRTVVLLN